MSWKEAYLRRFAEIGLFAAGLTAPLAKKQKGERRGF